MSRHIGSRFDAFLQEMDLLDHAEEIAGHRVLAYRVRSVMREQALDLEQLAQRLDLSEVGLRRLLEGSEPQVEELLFLAQLADRLADQAGEAESVQLKQIGERLRERYISH